jgi:catechol 2,3-dioxygenase-like lactoylglutathione lyase family enzyme
MIDSIDHFVITVADLEKTLDFYERVLGMQRVVAPGRPTALTFGQQKINVHAVDRTFEPKALHPTSGSADFCLVSGFSPAEIERHLQACGVSIELGPVERIGARGRMTSFYFRDPDGNLIEVSNYA